MNENRVNIAAVEAPFTRLAKRYRHNTRYSREGETHTLWLHRTPIVKVDPGGLIQLNTGGWETATTKRRMNEALYALGADFSIYQENFTWRANRYTHGLPPIDYLDHQRYQLDGTLVPW